MNTGAQSTTEFSLESNSRRFSAGERLKISIAAQLGALMVFVVGRNLRWEIHGWENWEAAQSFGHGLIYTFWHREICAATWFWRKRGIVVMTSQNFDGEYIARIINRYGYGAARGSSSRGAGRALAQMVRCLKNGLDAAFTTDGPRGPRFVAKQGSVILAKATGAAILCFHIAPRRAYTFRKSWDRFQIPCPFTRCALFIAPPIRVDRDAGPDEQVAKLSEVQAALDQLCSQGAAWQRG